MRAEREELDRVVDFERTQYESIVLKFCDSELQSITDSHTEDGGVGWMVGDWRVVVAIDDGDRIRRQNWLHADGLLTRDANGDEPEPSAAGGGTA